MRIVKEMRAIWFGTETHGGIREWGPRWVRALETKQKEQFGRRYNPENQRVELIVHRGGTISCP